MACSNVKTNAKHSRLCEIKYPYTLIADSNNVRATRFRNCTLNSVMVEDKEVVQTLGYEANMDLISIGEFDALMGDNDKFGTYCGLPGQKHSKTAHFCVDKRRRTVDGRRLAWLWVFPNGKVHPVHKGMADKPTMLWTKQQIMQAYTQAKNETLPMFTRHVDTYSELAITFCLPFPK